jgi:lipopolysaccharide heptosyltransferase I
MRSLLIIRLSALGDVVHVLPALAALRAAFPEARIGWAVEEKAASLLEGHPQIDRLHVIPRQALAQAARSRDVGAFVRQARQSVRELRHASYETTLDFQSNFRSSLLAFLSGAKRRIGQPVPYSKEGARVLVTETPAAVERTVHKIERNLRLLAPLGVEPARPPRPVIPEPERARLLAEGVAGAVLLHPGVSAFGAFKAWRAEGYAALARYLKVERGARVLVAWGGAAEREAALEVVALSRGAAELAPETRSILDLAALQRRAALFVGADSGPLHLAAALGTKVLGLYGPKDPRTYGPYWENARVVRKGVPCSPCTLRRCARPECMTLITADEVTAAALALL